MERKLMRLNEAGSGWGGERTREELYSRSPVALPDISGASSNDEAMALYEAEGYCGARLRKKPDQRCLRPAGWGTEHRDVGRCKLHGGRSPIKSGRYTEIVRRGRLADLYDEFKADPDPLNMMAELHMMRALAIDFINRYDELAEALELWWAAHQARKGKDKTVRAAAALVLEGTPPDKVPDIVEAQKVLEAVTKAIKRVEDIRAKNAISRADLFRLMREMGRVVYRRNAMEDPEKRLDAIERDWQRIQF